MEIGVGVEVFPFGGDACEGVCACRAAWLGGALEKMSIALGGSGATAGRGWDEFIRSMDATSDREVLVNPFEYESLEVGWQSAHGEGQAFEVNGA